MNQPDPGEPCVIFCFPNRYPKGLDTATIGNCYECGQKVWVSPSSLEMVRKHPATRLVCSDCFSAVIDKAESEGEPVKFGILPGTPAELVEHFRKTAAARNN